jgi:hypothetical protein
MLEGDFPCERARAVLHGASSSVAQPALRGLLRVSLVALRRHLSMTLRLSEVPTVSGEMKIRAKGNDLSLDDRPYIKVTSS